MLQINEGPPKYIGTTLSVDPWHYHVPSDNAMIDSGEGIKVTFYNGILLDMECVPMGRGGVR